ncbi:hypothetical protein AA0323_0994 [Asaia siamensis NRIC 0323]|nr:hypothetical protein AA0323_0994 [Asaia siamensis NRIC 0323]
MCCVNAVRLMTSARRRDNPQAMTVGIAGQKRRAKIKLGRRLKYRDTQRHEPFVTLLDLPGIFHHEIELCPTA